MKKLLLATGILALSMTAFAYGDNAETGVVEVKAKVVQPLLVSTTPVDYGVIIQGELKSAEKWGNVDITGTAGEIIKLEVAVKEGQYVDYTGVEATYPVELKTGTGETLVEKMTSELSLFNPGEQGGDYSKGLIQLPSEGTVNFIVDGPLRAGRDQKPGLYTGNLYVRAMYQ